MTTTEPSRTDPVAAAPRRWMSPADVAAYADCSTKSVKRALRGETRPRLRGTKGPYNNARWRVWGPDAARWVMGEEPLRGDPMRARSRK